MVNDMYSMPPYKSRVVVIMEVTDLVWAWNVCICIREVFIVLSHGIASVKTKKNNNRMSFTVSACDIRLKFEI